MAIVFTYNVVRLDGQGHRVFRNQSKAEAYARSLKQSPGDKVQITRSAKGFAPYVYYL